MVLLLLFVSPPVPGRVGATLDDQARCLGQSRPSCHGVTWECPWTLVPPRRFVLGGFRGLDMFGNRSYILTSPPIHAFPTKSFLVSRQLQGQQELVLGVVRRGRTIGVFCCAGCHAAGSLGIDEDPCFLCSMDKARTMTGTNEYWPFEQDSPQKKVNLPRMELELHAMHRSECKSMFHSIEPRP